MRLFTNSKIVRDVIEMTTTGTLAGSSLIIQIQIAIVGIIIVLGVFFIWRAMSRIEQRLNIVEINQKTLTQCSTLPSFNKGGSIPLSCPISSSMCSLNTNQNPNIQTFSTSSVSGEFTEIDEFADEMIKVFGNNNHIFETGHSDHTDHSDNSESSESDTHVSKHTEETNIQSKNPESDSSKATTTTTNIEIIPVVKNTSKQMDEVLSEADTEPGNPLSKSKLKMMNLEKLKAICTHHNLSTEGSKNILISRILGEIRD